MSVTAIDAVKHAETGRLNLADSAAKEKRFDWPLCYEAENWMLDQIQAFLDRNAFAARLAERMRNETGTLLVDWVDYLVLPADVEPAVRNAGFADDPLGELPISSQKSFWHPEAMLPRVILDGAARNGGHPHALAIHV